MLAQGGAQVLAVLDGLSLSKVHWVGESSGGISAPERYAQITRRRATG
jgi:hypothetical protein